MINNTKNKKYFVSIIWGYFISFYNFTPEENYHLHILKVAKNMGFIPVVIISNKKIMINDPHFDSEIKVIDYKNFLYFIFNVIRFSVQNSIFYVNSYEWQSFIVPFLARRTIFMAHNQPKRKTKIKQIIQNFVYKFFTAIKLNNEDEKQFLVKQGVKENKLFVIPLAISQNIFKLKEIDIERKNLVYFGNVALIKNLNTILMALKEVLIKKPNIKLNIIGKITDDEFITKIKKLKLDRNVILHGHIAQNEKLTNLLNSMLISINSSVNEGQCVAVYNTALCGCALCLPKIMSFEGVFKDKALFHEVSDYKQLAKNMLFYLDNPATINEHRTKCIEMIKKDYSKEIIEKKLKNLILKI
ncbi:MAG: glycosyltransferase [Patescibacteria group bacterium]